MIDRDDNDDDAALFRSVVGKVRPVTDRRISSPGSRRRPPTPLQHDPAPTAAVDGSPAPLPEAGPGDPLEFRRPGIARRRLIDLRRGRPAVDGEIDLHGMTAAAATRALDAFLNEAVARGLRSLRIVHGKGLRSGEEGPVLKRLVADHLVRREEVLAYISALPEEGGTGALCVLLRSAGR